MSDTSLVKRNSMQHLLTHQLRSPPRAHKGSGLRETKSKKNSIKFNKRSCFFLFQNQQAPLPFLFFCPSLFPFPSSSFGFFLFLHFGFFLRADLSSEPTCLLPFLISMCRFFTVLNFLVPVVSGALDFWSKHLAVGSTARNNKVPRVLTPAGV
jgi:hypothetical protein